MDKQRTSGLTRAEQELLDSYNRMIAQNGWLDGPGTADAKSKIKAGFRQKLGKVGEGHYYNYMLLVQKSSEARKLEESGAAKPAGTEEVSKYYEELKIPEYEDAFSAAKKAVDSEETAVKKDMQQVRIEAEYKAKQIEDAAQVILNWDEKYKKAFEENKEPEIYDETLENINNAPLQYNLIKERPVFTKNLDDMPIYTGFEGDLENIRYEFFEKDLENAKGITGVSSSVLSEIDPDKRLNIRNANALAVTTAAQEFIKAAGSNGSVEKKVVKGKEVEVRKELTMNEERELILKGLDILCHPAIRSANMQNASQARKEDENYAIKNDVFKMIRKLTSERAKDLDMRATDPDIKGPDGIEKAYKFIYDKAGYEGVAYYQWVTSLNASLDVMLSRNKLDRMEAHLEVGSHYRKALSHYYNDKADINYAAMSNYDKEMKDLSDLEANVAKLEAQYQEEYVGISKDRKERYGYAEKLTEWENTDARLHQELLEAGKKRKALFKLQSDIKHEIENTVLEIAEHQDKINDLSRQSEAEAKEISSSVEEAEKNLEEYRKNVSQKLKEMEDGTYEDTVKRIKEWTEDQGLSLAYELGDAKDYQSLLGVRKTLDEFENVIKSYEAHRLLYEADATSHFKGEFRADLKIEPELLPQSEQGCTALGQMIQTANIANHMLGKILVDVAVSSRFSDKENKNEAFEAAKQKAIYQLEVLDKTYNFKNMYMVTGGVLDNTEQSKNDFKEFSERYEAERQAAKERGVNPNDIAKSEYPYTYKTLADYIRNAKNEEELTSQLNNALSYGQAHWRKLDTVYRAQLKEAKLNMDKIAGKIMLNLPEGVTLDEIVKNYEQNKGKENYEDALTKLNVVYEQAEAERNEAQKKVDSLKGILSYVYKSKKLKDAEKELEDAERKFSAADKVHEAAVTEFGLDKLLPQYLEANERYQALKDQHVQCVRENEKNITYNSKEYIDYLAQSSEQTQKWYEGLKANREHFEKACKQQMIDTAEKDYLNSLKNIEATVNSQAQGVMTAVVEDVLKKNDKGKTLGEQIHDESVKKAAYDKVLQKYNENLVKVDAAIQEADAAVKAAQKNLDETTAANQKEKARLEKLCDDYVKQKALLFNKQGIMKNELPKMLEYFEGANDQYKNLRKLLPLTPVESEKLKQKDVKLEELVNGRPSNEFRESVEKELQGYFAAANLKQFKTSNSDDFTKMVNAIGKAIGKDPVDKSGKPKALKEPDEAKNYFDKGSLADCRKRLEEIKLAAEKYIDAKRDQKWILFPSDLRVHRLNNAISLVNYVENCLDTLTGNKKEYKVDAEKVNDPKNNTDPYGISTAKTEVVGNDKGLLKRHENLQNNFKSFITIPHNEGNVFEAYQSKVQDLNMGISEKSSNNNMQAFITAGLRRLNNELTATESALDPKNQSLNKTKVHIYVDKAGSEKLQQNNQKEKGLISSLFGAVKEKVVGLFKS